MPLFIADAADLVDKSIQKIALKGSTKFQTNYYEEFMNVERGITDYYMKDSSISGLGYAGRVVENAIVPAESPILGYDKTYTQVQFGKVLPVTKMMYSFKLHHPLVTMVQKFLKLRENLSISSYLKNGNNGRLQTICRQVREIKKFLKASETIIGTPILIG